MKSPYLQLLSPSFLGKKDISLLVGNALDHFDTALYGFLAPLLAPIFFPNYEPVVQLILTYSVLATSLITRPIGVLIFGMLVLRIGPLTTLRYSLLGMSIATILMGFLPGFQEIGWLAPAGLLLTRTLRGIFAAGENTIARVYILEEKTEEIALKASHFYESSTLFGIIIASLLATVAIIFKEFDCWRFTFCFGGLAGFIAYRFRRFGKEEKKAFLKIRTDLPKTHLLLSTTLRLLWNEKGNIVRVALTAGFSYLTYSVSFVLMNGFIPLITDISIESMMALNTTLLIFDMLAIPVIGRFLQKYTLIVPMMFACVVLAITIVPLFVFLPQASLGYVSFVRIWVAFWGVVFLCPLNLWRKMIFPNTHQYLLLGISNTLGASSIGRLTPVIGLWLWHTTELAWLPACYIVLVLIGVIWGLTSSLRKKTMLSTHKPLWISNS